MKKAQRIVTILFACMLLFVSQIKVSATESDEIKKITITYVCDAETKSVTINAGETLDLWIPEGKDGITFAYWITNPEAEIEDRNIVTNETVFYENTVLYPVWNDPLEEIDEDEHPVLSPEDAKNLYPPEKERTEYFVWFEVDGEKVCTIAVEKNTSIVFFPIEPEKDGYFFLGWYTEKEGGTRVTQKTIIESDMTVYAQWEKIKDGYYLTKFDKNYGTEDLIVAKMVSKKLDYLPEAFRSGYEFLGWYTEKESGRKVKLGEKLKSNMTLYAHWKKVTVKKATIKSLSSNGSTLTVRYKKVKAVDGYEVQVSLSRKFKAKKTISRVYKNNKVFTRKISKLKANKKYYVRLRAYKLDSTDARVYGKWSKVKKIKINKSKI